jgi:hypothetical protein
MRGFRVLLLTCLTLTALPLLAAAAPATPAAGGDHWHEDYTADIQLDQFMGRLHEVLSSEQYFGKYPEVAGMAEVAKRMGYFNLDNLHCEYTVKDGEIRTRFSEHFAGLPADSYLGKVYALPNRDLVSATYLAQDDYLMYFAMNNVPQQVLISLQEVGNLANDPPTGMEDVFSDMGEVGQVLGMVTAMGIDKQIESILTGEIGMAFYRVPDHARLMNGDIQPGDIDASVFVGLAGSEALDTLLAGFGGQAGLVAIDSGSPAWKAYEISAMPGAGLMYNNEILIAAPSLTRAASHLQNIGSGMNVEAVQYFFDLNVTALHDQVIAPLADFGMGMASQEGIQFPTQAMAYLWGLPGSDALGHITAQGRFDSGYACEMRMSTAVPQYLMYYLTTGGIGVLESELHNSGGSDDDYEGEEYEDGGEDWDEEGSEDDAAAPMAPEAPVASEPAPTV